MEEFAWTVSIGYGDPEEYPIINSFKRGQRVRVHKTADVYGGPYAPGCPFDPPVIVTIEYIPHPTWMWVRRDNGSYNTVWTKDCVEV